MSKRAFLIVLDSAGIGNAPDAEAFGDQGADTWGTCVRSGKLKVPTFEKLGLFNIEATSFRNPKKDLIGNFGRLTEKSKGKDTTVGHWEICGLVSEAPLPIYPNGFPEEVISEFEQKTGRKVLCNLPYSGTQVLKDYGKEACKTGALIVYTSADSVFQIAAHEEIIPTSELYRYCEIARKMLVGAHGVGRVIARPFTGEWPYERTVNRHDFSLEPPKETLLDQMMQQEFDTIGVGKIYDIFAGRGISETYPNQGNVQNMEKVFGLTKKEFNGLCFVNLVDTDMLYGHRRDIAGYVESLNTSDEQIGRLISLLGEEDLLIITADHGCDPGFKGTDHTRESIPVLCYGKNLKKGVNLGSGNNFSNIAATIAEFLNVRYKGVGESFYQLML